MKHAKSKPYIIMIKKSFKEQMEYQVDFYLRCLYEISIVAVNLIFFDVIYYQIGAIGNWSLEEIKILVLVAALLDGVITFFFVEGLNRLPGMISTGEIEYLLLRPINKRIYISFYKVCASQIISISIFALYTIVLMIKSGFTFMQLFVFGFMFIVAAFILYCLFFCIMCLSFWTIRVDIGVSLFFQLFNMGNKPMEVYPVVVRKILSFVVPIGLAINYPVISLTSYFTVRHLVEEVVVAVFMFFVSHYILKKGLERYESIG